MQSNTLLFLLIASGLSLALAQVTYGDCCLAYMEKMRPAIQKHAVDYTWQVTDGDCNIPAIVITMRKGRVLCANPKDRWVQQLMKKINKRKVRIGGKKSPRKAGYY